MFFVDIGLLGETGIVEGLGVIFQLYKIDWIYKTLRNRSTRTATLVNFFADDATTVDSKLTHSDDGTTYDKGEMVTGP